VPFAACAPRFLAALPAPGFGGKGKAAGGRGWGVARLSAADAPAPKPLDALEVAQVTNHLLAMGGALRLGKLATDFPGLKKAQLFPHFQVVMAPDQGDFIVALPGHDPTVPLALPAPTRKRPREQQPHQEALEPLPEWQAQNVRDFVAGCGGYTPLGRVTTVFEGVKKAQLQFAGLTMVGGEGGREPFVCSGTLEAEAALLADQANAPPESALFTDVASAIVPAFTGEPERKKKKKKEQERKDPNAPPPPPLEAEVVDRITALVQAHGGRMSLGKLTTTFEGVKKVQLEPHFLIRCHNKEGVSSGDFTVSLHDGSAVAELAPEVQQTLGLLGTLGAPLVAVPQVPGPRLPAAAGVSKKKKNKAKRVADFPPTMLEPSKVEEIAAFLHACGGAARMGKLSTAFPGLKKAQIEPHFVVCGDPSSDHTICLDAAVVAANGFQPA